MRATLKNTNCIVLVEIHKKQLTDSNITNEMFAGLINDIGYNVYDTNGEKVDSNRVLDHECIILSRTQPQGIR